MLLNEIGNKKIDEDSGLYDFIAAYEWFKNLIIVYPNSHAYNKNDFFLNPSSNTDSMIDMLRAFDTGIEKITKGKELAEKAFSFLPDEVKKDLLNDIEQSMRSKPQGGTCGRIEIGDQQFEISVEDGEIVAEKIMLDHGNSEELFELSVSYLHKKFGSGFGTLDNSLSAGGGKIDDILKMWYGAWHSPKEVRMSRQLLIYILCMGVVLGPALFKLDEKWRMGENLYITGETSVINWFKQRGIYDAADVLNVGEEIIEKKSGLEETVFVVSGVNNSLLVRDIPDTENCMVLDRLKNDDEVILTGDMTFAETENGHIEPWVRVITENGIEGWSRLFYLHPKEYQGIEFYLQDHEE